MSTTAAAHPQLRRRAGSQIPRRKSGPARPAPKPRQRAAPGQRHTLAHALLAGARRLGDARMLDRLVRGRVWLGIVAVALLGIVFMQVSLLRLNASVGTAVTKADTLERVNSGLRGDISKLDSGERIQDVAAKLGMVMPPAGDVHFLDARGANAAVAATSITAPDPVKDAAPAVATTAPAVTAATAPTVTSATTTPQPAPVAATPAQTAPAVAQQAQTPAPVTPAPTAAATTQAAPAATAGAVAAPTGAR